MSSPREPVTRTLWERFCREEAKEVALTFLERVRKFKGRNPSVTEVHDTVFTNEFSAAFLEEASILMAEGQEGIQRRENQAGAVGGGRRGGKWWSNIFKWPKFSRGRSNEAEGQRLRPSILEGTMQMLNLSVDPMQVATWQGCKLCLTEALGSYQLEVYMPAKCGTPRMSLFCFLIDEVRSTSDLEMPDSTSCFVIKAQNHGEYVFDAGSQALKLKWIRTILQHSARPQTNGRVSAANDSQRGALLSATLPRTSPNSVSSEELVRTLAASPTVYGRRGSSPTEQRLGGGGGAGGREGMGGNVNLRASRQISPSRQRKAHSMFVETAGASHHQRFPYADLPPQTTTPPPLPRRLPARYRPTSPPLLHASSHQASNGRVPPAASRRKYSQPTLELPSPMELANELHSPGTLESCSQSSSTSALHPVSIAAVQRGLANRRRGSASSTSPPEVQQRHLQQQPSVHGRERKVSAPVFSNERQTRDEHTRHSHHHHHQHQHSADLLLATAIEAVLEQSGGREEELEPLAAADSTEPPEEREGEDPAIIPVIESSEELQEHRQVASPQREPSGDFRTASSSPSSSSSSSSPSSSSNHPEEPTNPIYLETTEGQEVAPTASFTHHPYESWATSQRDMDNLRALSQFPWFHGMISRIKASEIVLVNGEEGLGDYLVRQSESREGDFVLTFNYHNRAKHLRMTVDESGCNIQHLWFDNVASMLEYFKTNSIPLESFWLNDDVKLTTYIDRAASDAFRTTTVLNVDRLARVPPRRSSSLHLGISQATQLSGSSSPGETTQQPSPSSPLTSSLPHSARNSTGWRQFFRSQRSSSAGNVGRIQRRHSTNAGSVLDTQQQRRSRTENAYIARNY